MSNKRLITVTLDDPRTLADVLAVRLPLDLAAAQQLVLLGSVFLDGRRANDPAQPVSCGQRVCAYVPVVPPVHNHPAVLHEDESILIVNKPTGLPCQPGRRGGLSLLSSLTPAYGPLFLPHRLDEDASGLTMLARSKSAAAKLGVAFASHTVSRTYAARVVGLCPPTGKIELRIGQTLRGVQRLAYPKDSAMGLSARTYFQTAAQTAGETLLWLRLATGRTHQLRVHLAALGHPILGDKLYGGAQAERLYLHALELSFFHPQTGKHHRIKSGLPPLFWPAPLSIPESFQRFIKHHHERSAETHNPTATKTASTDA